MLEPWRETVRQEGAHSLGFATTAFERRDCFERECRLGNLLADASVEAYSKRNSKRVRVAVKGVRVCLLHVGATRNTLRGGSEYLLERIIYICMGKSGIFCGINY